MTMKFELKHIVFYLCAALTFAACNKITSPEDNLITFSAEPQVSWVTPETKAFPEDGSFGVWGIMRRNAGETRTLWGANELVEATKQTNGGFKPENDAYWFSGFTYNFLALAPFNTGAKNVSISSSDELSFTFDMADKYPDYDYDLLAAVAQTSVNKASTQPQQSLKFWHLLTRININVSFVDAAGSAITDQSKAKLDNIRLYNVATKGIYNVSYSATATSTDNLLVTCTDVSSVLTTPLTFISTAATLYIIPQNISNFKLYLDYTMDVVDDKGTESTEDDVTYSDVKVKDFEVNLFPETNTPRDYKYNDQYNWNLKIGPRKAVTFTATVANWQTGDSFEIPIK